MLLHQKCNIFRIKIKSNLPLELGVIDVISKAMGSLLSERLFDKYAVPGVIYSRSLFNIDRYS